MDDRYFGKVVSVQDEYTVVLNKGSEEGLKTGQKFLIVGLGEVIKDPDTGDELERLELVRGHVEIVHVQQKISTLKSYRHINSGDIKEIKKTTSHGAFGIIPPQETVTESTKPGQKLLEKIKGVAIGDYVIKI